MLVSKRLQEWFVEVKGFSFSNAAITHAEVRVGEIKEGDVERFREQYGIGEGTVVFLTIDMTTLPYMAAGLKLLIQAVWILRESYPNIVLIAAREVLREGVGMEEQMVFTGDVENPLYTTDECVICILILPFGGVSVALLEADGDGEAYRPDADCWAPGGDQRRGEWASCCAGGRTSCSEDRSSPVGSGVSERTWKMRQRDGGGGIHMGADGGEIFTALS